MKILKSGAHYSNYSLFLTLNFTWHLCMHTSTHCSRWVLLSVVLSVVLYFQWTLQVFDIICFDSQCCIILRRCHVCKLTEFSCIRIHTCSDTSLNGCITSVFGNSNDKGKCFFIQFVAIVSSHKVQIIHYNKKKK